MDKKGFMVISRHFSLILLATRDYRNPNTQWSAEGLIILAKLILLLVHRTNASCLRGEYKSGGSKTLH